MNPKPNFNWNLMDYMAPKICTPLTCGVAVGHFCLQSVDGPSQQCSGVRARGDALQDDRLPDEEREWRLRVVHRDRGRHGVFQVEGFLGCQVALAFKIDENASPRPGLAAVRPHPQLAGVEVFPRQLALARVDALLFQVDARVRLAPAPQPLWPLRLSI